MNHEALLIGELMFSPESIPVVNRVVLDSSFFAQELYGKYFDAILETYQRHGTVDSVLIGKSLESRKLKDSVLLDLVSRVSNAYDIEAHARYLAEKYARRQALSLLTGLAKDVKDDPDVFEAIDVALAHLARLKTQFQTEHVVSMSHVAMECMEEMEEIQAGRKQVGIPLGFHDIDRVMGGIDGGDLVIIAGLEKSGKTTLMLQSVFHIARKGFPVLVFSAEMNRKALLYRIALLEESLRWIDMKNRSLSENEWARLYKRVTQLAPLPIYVRHGDLSLVDISSDVERFVKERNIKVVAIDYTQRINAVTKKSDSREREVASLSAGFKAIAMRHEIPVIALSQLNEDLRARESRAIEQDMDKMITIKNENPGGMMTGYACDLKVRQRMGLSGNFGDVRLYYDLISGSWKDYTDMEVKATLNRYEPEAQIF